eukprot:gene4804-8390_t
MEEVFSKEEIEFYQKNGYIVLKSAVTKEACDDVVSDIFKYCKLDKNDTKDWYKPPLNRNGMLNLSHSQSIWNNRQSEKIYRAFSQLYNNPKLWVSIDRCCFKLPINDDYPKYLSKGFVHWDLDIWDNINSAVDLQGVLALEDTDETMGGFHCVPGMNNEIEYFKKKYENKVGKKEKEKFHFRGIPINIPMDMYYDRKYKLKKIIVKKGDLIIWKRELAHGNGENLSNVPRLAQYINMYPVPEDKNKKRSNQECLESMTLNERISCWESSTVPKKFGDFKEIQMNTPAKLTDLGQKLLGIEHWDYFE